MAEDRADLESIIPIHRQLRESPPYERELKALAEAQQKAEEAQRRFQGSLSPDALLRKLVLGSRCDWCP